MAARHQNAPTQIQTVTNTGRYIPIEVSSTVEETQASESGHHDNRNIEPNGKVQLVIPRDISKVTGQNQYLLGLYRVNDDGSLTYVGGKVDASTGTITADVDHLSTYATLTYQANFTDTKGNWAQDDINVLAAHHVVNGTTATTFEPNGQVTRAEFAAMLVRLLGSASGTANYKDVASDAWYASAVGAAEAAGLVKGFPDGTFHPNDPITREQMAVLIDRALGASAPSSTDIKSELGRFTDASMIDSWAQAGATTVVQQLIIQGGCLERSSDLARTPPGPNRRRC